MNAVLRHNRFGYVIKKLASRCYGSLDFDQFEDVANKTTMTLTSGDSDVDPLLITGLYKGGFAFQATTLHCPVTIVRDVIFKWNVTSPEEVTSESLSIFHMIYPKIDMVVIGTGDVVAPLRPHVVEDMRKLGIGCEVQSTRNAAGTFNLLRSERRMLVAAALIPLSLDDNETLFLPKHKRYQIE
uniref:NADH dehydrogenase [ubiquinone] 1 alpha subcomplex assembly factor 3 n=1 Tax=Ciona intestinalis TaxID=7719 RepID=UPI000180B382|nr:NADH dehydrogenase [ubiquinone] 1 alpha subcomplex assembly factor 3 [Ciona intestinalis]|eukprot:XP_002122641.1 NADH dehydrogenase [ubiquinone] 1 alpha subcomplex assembly factor 3 [Ciona intestinalis]